MNVFRCNERTLPVLVTAVWGSLLPGGRPAAGELLERWNLSHPK